MQKPDYPVIKERYEEAYKNAIYNGRKQIMAHIDDWPKTLNEIKTAGIFLYPIYPVGELFVNFGNPFHKIGIEIFYKTNGLKEKEEKLKILKDKGWRIYPFETKYISYVLEDLFKHVAKDYTNNSFEELDAEEKQAFIEKYKETNLECLIYYIMNEMN